MARIGRVERGRESFVLRMVRRLSRRRLGVEAEPMEIAGHHTRLLLGVGAMEYALQGGGRVPASLKELAQIKAATLVGCRW